MTIVFLSVCLYLRLSIYLSMMTMMMTKMMMMMVFKERELLINVIHSEMLVMLTVIMYSLIMS